MKSQIKNFDTVSMLGTNIHALRMDDLLQICDNCITHKELLLIGVANVAKIVNCRRDPQLRQSLDETDLTVADGMPLIWLSRLMGHPLPERVPGIDLMHRLLELSSRKNYRVYFLGAKKQVVETVAAYTQQEHPGVRIAGCHDGYFTQEQEQQIAEEIRNSSADVIFVAMTSPKKENFLRRWREYVQIPICHGVGGSFDVVAGVTKRAPRWMQQSGLEWLYRVIQEPGRMWKRYLVTNTIFIVLSIGGIAQARFRKLKNLFLPLRNKNTVKPQRL